MKLLTIRSIRVGTIILGLAGTAAWAAEGTGPVPPLYAANETSSNVGTSSGEKGNAPLSAQDAQFLNDAASRNFAQIALGFLAIEKAATNGTKSYARDRIDAAVKSNKKLLELASRKNVMVPVGDIKLPTDELSQLSQKAGNDFDKAYVISAVNDGVKTEAYLKQFLTQVQDKGVRDFANESLSNTGDELSDARKLGGQLGIASQELNPPPPVAEAPSPGPKAMPSPGSESMPSPGLETAPSPQR